MSSNLSLTNYSSGADLVPLRDLLLDLRYQDTRPDALARITARYDEWLKGTGPEDEEDEENTRNLLQTIPSILNLSLSCPYKEVRDKLSALLVRLRAAGKHVPEPVHRGVSYFIAESKILPLDADEASMLKELQDAFDSDGRLTHMTRLMAFHPRFLKTFRLSLTHLLWGEGPLSIPIRHLLAVMGASRHSCHYLIKIYTNHYLENDGDPKLLDGPHALPPKLRSICDLSAIMAHKPWMITADHINKLVRSPAPGEGWSLPELVHACLILSRFHTLPGFIFGLGCVDEVDIKNTATDMPSARSSSAPSRGSSSPVKGLADRLEPLEIAPDSTRTLLSRMRQLDTQPLVTPVAAPSVRKEIVADAPLSALGHGFEPNGAESVAFYSDFSQADYATFCFQTFSWQDEAFATLTRYNERMAELLTEEFQTIKDLTYETMGDAIEVDTRKFRWAVWNYVFSLYGVTDREYLYAEVDVLVQGSLREWIKTIGTTPHRAEKDRKLYESFLDLKDSEKAHMCLLVIEARYMAAMLYLLNAVCNFADR